MHTSLNLSRRNLLQGAAAMAATWPLAGFAAESSGSDSLKGRMYKTLKIGMVKVPGSMTEKFQAVKEAGFDGIELQAPGYSIPEVNEAIKATGIPVDGNVCAGHWQVRHTDPSEAVRKQALETLKQALRDTHAVGGHTLLLVVGHGKDGTEDECWKRSVDNIAQAIPLAAELGVHLAIENVWNEFLYDHEGGSNQSAEKFVKYVDEFDSPWVGMQFDIGNHWKYGATGDWIRQLDQRIIKLDVKGFSRKAGKFTKVGEGDIDWADVRKSLLEINYHGWVAAEVAGGDLERLKEVSANLDRAFGLG
ncbi:sugar phosphate isomerase/epimerase family protein [Rubinisphaera margarita]|uniref:sugar phosphate isomerase/epimerase family protein n=1 Tax=Rubinisphaera margarita TaxID=2909586 RepID=UPI001EE9936C|nr:sugar phosphate isomerase/epimerase family protein [Rubinisphaera margarita]MCG6154871.1 sugar phosphate isomerase/epimerase [Rubinisphaera margarita]